MYGDQTGGMPSIIVSQSELHASVRNSYSFIVDTVFDYNKRKETTFINTVQLTNGDTSGLLIPVQIDATMTEMPHVGVTLQPNKINKYVEMIAHNVSDFSKTYSIQDTSLDILDNLTIKYDMEVFNGAVGSGGEILNYGLFNNPYVTIKTPVANIEVVDDLSSTMELLRQEVVEVSACLDSEVVFVFSGANTRSFLKRFSGADYRSNADIIQSNFNNAMVVLPINIYSGDQIYAFCNKKVKGYSTGLPTLFKQGRSGEDKYYDFYHFTKGSFGTEFKKRGVAVKQGLTFNTALLKGKTLPSSKKPESSKPKKDADKPNNDLVGLNEGD